MARRRVFQAGFTLVELMVVIAIIGILAAMVAIYVDPGSYSRSTAGYAEALAAEIDDARWRAVGSNRWHMLSIESTNLRISRTSDDDAVGMSGLPLTGGTCADPFNGGAGNVNSPDLALTGSPSCWGFVRSLMVPQGIDIVKAENVAQLNPGVTTTGDGDGLNDAILIGPDGTIWGDNGWTIYVANSDRTEFYRVVVFRATATATVLEGW